MGYGEYGGGGSIKWEIDVDEGNLPSINEKPGGNPRKYKVNSVDRKGIDDAGRFFLVTLENPTGIEVKGTTLKFKVPIVNNNSKPQVKVEWVFETGDQALKDMKDVTAASIKA